MANSTIGFIICLIIALAISVICVMACCKFDPESAVLASMFAAMAIALPLAVILVHKASIKEYRPNEYNIEQMAEDYNAKVIKQDRVNCVLKYYTSSDEWVYYVPLDEVSVDQYRVEG